MNAQKKEALKKLSNPDGVIAALAIDQRGAIQKMVTGYDETTRDRLIIDFKKTVSKVLTSYASAILLDPIYGLEAIDAKDPECGLLMAYEITGYRDAFRQPELLPEWSVYRLVEKGADAVKILLYYDVDDTEENNTKKHIMIERIGAECAGWDIPFFLELITYDQKIADTRSPEFARIKPDKVIRAMQEFSKPRYQVDVLKVEVPVNMAYVEGYGTESVYTKKEARDYFKAQSDATDLPFIFLSAGVDTALFLDTLRFAKESGSTFNGVLCGRATWAGGVPAFISGEQDGLDWLNTVGRENIDQLNRVLKETATPWDKDLA